MATNGNENGKEEIEESSGPNAQDQSSLNVSVSRRTLLSDKNPQRKFQDSLASLPNRINFLKFGSASAKFKQLAQEKDEMSRSVASSSGHHFRERLSGLSQKLDWAMLTKMFEEWIRDPMNMALFAWIMCVAISGAILFLVMTGMLNHAIPKKSQRDTWFEVNNQILNALFTLMCLYQHPKRFYHLVLLCRWSPEDVSRLRKIYCKNGTYKPHEWTHMMVVVILLHINCFAQYALCGLNLGYRRSERPGIGVALCISFAIAAPAIAGVYTIISPLGKDYDSEGDEEAQVQIATDEGKGPAQLRLKSFEKTYSFASSRDDQRIIETRPRWSGGLLDFWDDISIAYLSLFCSFCVFGWNMERLGFGNMYVHIATFILFCVAPFWIFNLAAVTIDHEAVRQALVFAGIVLCAFGLLYGGFWRIQMRKRFNLPAYTFCFGVPSISDCTLWLCCCWCSLAQEVRTGNSYDIVEDRFYRKQVDNSIQPSLSPFSPKDGSDPSSSTGKNHSPSSSVIPNSPSPRRVPRGFNTPDRQLPAVREEPSPVDRDETMIPPAPTLIEREAT